VTPRNRSILIGAVALSLASGSLAGIAAWVLHLAGVGG
jgi:hypothetical protein